MITTRPHATLLVALVLPMAACSGSEGTNLPDGNPYVPSDGGVDGDADGDADGGEWGADGDGDADHEVPPLPGREQPEEYQDYAALCLDGESATRDGLADCETVECLADRACCRQVDGSWVQGDFEECSTPEACGWQVFGPTSSDANVAVSPEDGGWLVLSGQGAGEAGAVATAVVDTAGEPTVTFLAGLGSDGAPCDDVSCRHALGVALTSEPAPSAATGVTPLAGVVLDGELLAVHLYVDGRIAESVHRSAADLSASQTYGFRLLSEGSVEFWIGREGAIDASRDTPDHVAGGAEVAFPGDVHLAVYGRFSGEVGGRVGAVRLERQVCDVPGALSRVAEAPVFAPEGSAGRPTVIRRPTEAGAPLLMVYESGGFLAVATSSDGLSWQVASERAVVHQAQVDYGLVARRAPTALFWAPDGETPRYHLWLEGESEDAGAPTAIVHATSLDGIEWHEAGAEAVAIPPHGGRRWRRHVGQPSVAVDDSGRLTMLFVGRNPETGATAVGRATSRDGVTWSVDDQPIPFAPAAPASFERDGVLHPTLVARGSELHVWYTGRAGARSSIGYAVVTSGDGGLELARMGLALEPEAPWETRRVGAPAVLVTGGWLGERSGLGSVMMWYRGGPPGAEGIALAARRLPADPVQVTFEQ